MHARAAQSRPSKALELETDVGTLKKMLVMVAGTTVMVAILAVCGVLVASGNLGPMFGRQTYITQHTTPADKFARQVVLNCKIGAVVLTASRDSRTSLTGQQLAGQCDEVGEAIKSLPVTR